MCQFGEMHIWHEPSLISGLHHWWTRCPCVPSEDTIHSGYASLNHSNRASHLFGPCQFLSKVRIQTLSYHLAFESSYRGICQPEGHGQPLKKSLLGFEGSLRYICGFDWNPMIAKLQINLVELLGSLKLVKKVIDPWDWIPVLESDFIQCLVINIESPGPILLLYDYNWAPKRWGTWSYVPFL